MSCVKPSVYAQRFLKEVVACIMPGQSDVEIDSPLSDTLSAQLSCRQQQSRPGEPLNTSPEVPAKVPSSAVLSIGQRVQVDGIVRMPQHNGSRGEVVSYHIPKQQYLVRLDAGKQLIVPAHGITAEAQLEEEGQCGDSL